MHTLYKNNVFKNVLIMFALAIGLTILFPKISSAYHNYYVDNPNVPDSEQGVSADSCPASSTASGQTIGNFYFSPTEITTLGGTGTTTAFGFAFMCSNSNYSSVSDPVMTIVGSPFRYAGSGNISLSGTTFSTLDIPAGDFDHATNPVTRTATLSSLSQGNNCWSFTYNITARYGGGAPITGTNGIRNLCVFYNPASNLGDCDIVNPTPSTVTVGQSFTASMWVSNMGQTNWVVGGYPQTGNSSTRYVLRTTSPTNNTTWGVSQVEIPKNTTYYTVPILQAGWSVGPFAYNFTAPTTPGAYLFSWRVSQLNTPANDNVGGCSKTINVVAAKATLSGAKIDNSQVSSTGSLAASPNYGGNCYSSVYPDRCNNGTLANYLFSDNCVSLDNGACITLNGFSTGQTIDPGIHTVSITPSGANDGTWVLLGYKICAVGGDCTTPYAVKGLTRSPLNNGSSFDFNFQTGVSYDMRFIYSSAAAPLSCSPSPQDADINENKTFEASGGSGGYDWSAPGGVITGTGNSVQIRKSSLGRLMITVLSGTQTVNCYLDVVEKPFFSVLGGDVGAGITTDSPGCTGWGVGVTTETSINSWNDEVAGSTNKGAGTNLAAIASKNIEGFASAQRRLAAPLPIIGLSFQPQSGAFGGNYPGGIPCPTDYYATKPTSNITVLVGLSYNPASLPLLSSAGTRTGNIEITTTGFYPVGSAGVARPVIYVDGDAYISGGIQIINGSTTPVDSLSNFYLIVKGNIYIAPNVGKLEGVYVAQPLDNGTKGKIYTCAYVDGVSYRAPTQLEINNNAVGKCRYKKLEVNGAFIAKELKLYRSINTLATNLPAELFNATPATWLATPCAISGNCTGGGNASYDAITSLPPIL